MDDLKLEQLVKTLGEDLYRFAFSLTRSEDQASELTQETFCRFAEKNSQLRDASKAKSWLFTTLYRIFLGWKRRERALPHYELSLVEFELPACSSNVVNDMDAQLARDELLKIEERFRTPLTLFYLEDLSYREIGELLQIPIGTVMSRIARGKQILRENLKAPAEESKIVVLKPSDAKQQQHD